VSFPFHLCSRDKGTVSHWQMACVHGKVAALNMLGREISIMDVVPYFWTTVCGVSVGYLGRPRPAHAHAAPGSSVHVVCHLHCFSVVIGYGEGYDETLTYGSPDEMVFCCVYRRRRRLNAVCCVGCGRLAAELALLLETMKEWVVDVPELIRKTFPNPPVTCNTQPEH